VLVTTTHPSFINTISLAYLSSTVNTICQMARLITFRISTQSYARQFASSAEKKVKEPYVLVNDKNRVRTVLMNRPAQLNGWTQEMMLAIQKAFDEAAVDSKVDVLILSGTGKYYCAGVNLSAILKPMHPQVLHDLIVTHNQSVFDKFFDFPKPIIVAMNGPAIGASVTTASTCDALLMAENATLLTPFARLGVPPEGCSSVHFAKVMGQEKAQRMLGKEAWTPTAAEAVEAGLAHKVVAPEAILSEAQSLAEEWIEKGRLHRAISQPKAIPSDDANRKAAAQQIREYKAVNAAESIELGRAFLGPNFLQGQIDFLTSKGKTQPAMFFKLLLATRPLWSKLLKKESDFERFNK
jgi:Delta3-Delta2-enoyl-CoA isomerase